MANKCKLPIANFFLLSKHLTTCSPHLESFKTSLKRATIEYEMYFFFLNWDLDIREGGFRFRSYDFLTVLDLEGCFWFNTSF